MHSLFPLSGLGDLRRLNDLRRTIFSNSRKDSEDNFITPRGAYHLINRVLQNNTITGPTTGTTGSTTSLPRWRQDVGKNPFSIFNSFTEVSRYIHKKIDRKKTCITETES